MYKKVVCFGEMLWDCFPDHEIPGGAPMNVALHLKQLGLDVNMISRLGKDTYGDKLLDFVKGYGLNTSEIQLDETHPTGTVTVDNKDPENIKYTINSPAAWDYVALTDSNSLTINQADAFIFGSLGVRNQASWDTLYHLIHSPVLKIFDINLRAPYFDFEQIEIILGYTDILKINEDELLLVADYFHMALPEDRSDMIMIAEAVSSYLSLHFPIQMVCVTLGSKGAMIYKNGKIFKHPGYKVQVEDTVGAGDAFLSGFVKSYLDGKNNQEILDFACALGAFVATKKGGTPKYAVEEVVRLQEKK